MNEIYHKYFVFNFIILYKFLLLTLFFNGFKLIKKNIINLYTVKELRLIDRQHIFLNLYIFLINYNKLN